MNRPTRSLRSGLAALCVVNMLPVAEADGSWLLCGLAALAAAISIAYSRRIDDSRLVRRMISVAVFASVAFLAVEMFWPRGEQTIYILDLAHFIILLTCCKFFELRTHRDMSVAVLMAFLLLVIGAFVSASPIFACVLLIDLTFGLFWLVSFQTHRDIELLIERRRRELPESLTDSLRRSLMAESRFGPGQLRAGSLLALSLAAMAFMTFVALPRAWGRGLLGRMHRYTPASVTGFTDEIQLRSGPILQDETIVLRARFFRNGESIGGEDFTPYLRGTTHDRYRNRVWQRAPAGSAGTISVKDRAGPVSLDPDVDFAQVASYCVEQQIWMEGSAHGTLFGLYRPLAIASSDLRRVAQSASDATLRTDERLRGPIAYQLFSSASEGLNAELEVAPPEPRDGGIDRKVRAFAAGYFGEPGVPVPLADRERVARAVCEHLRSGEFEYTLNRGGIRAGADPIEDFLFRNPRGHCEYFASAMTALCQSLGIPARLVNGFCGGEYNAVGRFYQFRNKDAHVWVEVYLPRRGWVSFDPSPASPIRESAREESLWADCARFLDFLRFKWSTLVVTFDTRSRGELFQSLERWVRQMQEDKQGPSSLWEIVKALLWGPEAMQRWERVIYWVLLVLAVVFLGLAVRVLWILSIMLQEYFAVRRRGEALVREPEAKFYDRLLLLLAHKGYVKPRHLTPREFAGELARSSADLSDLPVFAEWFYEAQYGHRPLPRERHARLDAFLRRLREDAAFAAR